MKRTLKITMLAALTALLMPTAISCIRDVQMQHTELAAVQGQPVTIVLDTELTHTGGTRATDAGNALDRKVESLRILIYNSRTGRLEWNFAPDELPVADLAPGTVNGSQQITLDITTGDYDFVFIGNEIAGAYPEEKASELEAAFGTSVVELLANEDNFDTMAELSRFIFSLNSFPLIRNNGGQASGLIPMVTFVPDVKVSGNNRIDSPSTGPLNGTWSVKLERLAVRLDIDLILTAEQYPRYTTSPNDDIVLTDPTFATYLMPQNDNMGHLGMLAGNSLSFKMNEAQGDFTHRQELDADNAPTGRWIVSGSLIIPERILSEANDIVANAMGLKVYDGGNNHSSPIWYKDENDDPTYSLPRNTFLKLTAEVVDSRIVFSDIVVVDWGATTDVNMTDRGTILPQSGVPAPPGVLGVNSRTGELTLVGSVHYKNTLAATQYPLATTEFGAISNDPVYTAYFKYGSLIAMNIPSTGDLFTADDIAWAPKTYNVEQLMKQVDSAADPAAAYMAVPAASNAIVNNPVGGLGDPCKFAEGGNGMYKTPSIHQGAVEIGTPFDLTDFKAGTLYPSFDSSQISGYYNHDYSIFSPYFGYRMGRDTDLPYIGASYTGTTPPPEYWTNTPNDATSSHYVRVIADKLEVYNTGSPQTGLPIRCVNTKEPSGIKAVQDVIGYIWNPGQPNHLELTLAGDKDYYGNPAGQLQSRQNKYRVYMAYFKFGSLVATSGNRGRFNVNQIVAWPSEWIDRTDRTALNAYFGSETGTTAVWSKIPTMYHSYSFSYPTLFPSEEVPADQSKALDDPCDYYFGYNGYKTATMADNNILVGRPTTEYGYYYNTGSEYYDYVHGTDFITDPDYGVLLKSATALPGTGHRDSGTGYLTQDTGQWGRYWSSTLHGSQAFEMVIQNTRIIPNTGQFMGYGYPVRCVQKEPEAIKAVQDVIGYIWNPGQPNHLELTLAGDKDYYDNPAGQLRSRQNKYRVFMAYFKFGSLVALDGRPGKVSVNSIVAWPDEWIDNSDRTALNEYFKGTSHVNTVWYNIPTMYFENHAIEERFPSATWPADRSKALDDPCAYYDDIYFGDYGWKTPTRAESRIDLGFDGADQTNDQYDSGSAYYNWIPAGADPIANPGVGVFPQSPYGTVALPAAGYRGYNQTAQDPGHTSQIGEHGHYWTSTYEKELYFQDVRTLPNSRQPIRFAFPVRCISEGDS